MSTTAPTGAPPVDFLPDGTISIRLATTHRLRRPKLKEYRKLREDFYAVNDQIGTSAASYRDEGQRLDAAVQALTNDDDGAARTDLSTEERDAVRGLRRESRELVDRMLDEQGDLRLGFFRQVADLLADVALEDDDEEAWMLGPDLLVQFFEHWMTVPLGRGPGGR